MKELKSIFQKALDQTWKDYKMCCLYDCKLIDKRRGSETTFKDIEIPFYENDVVIHIAHNLLNNTRFAKSFALFSQYNLYGTNREDIIISDRNKVSIDLDKDFMPKSSNELSLPVEIVAEVKLSWRKNKDEIIKEIAVEKKRLENIKRENHAKEVYLIIFTYWKEDLRYLEKEYSHINLKIFPLNVKVLLNI